MLLLCYRSAGALIFKIMPKGIYKHPIGGKSSHWKGGKPKCIDCGKKLSGYGDFKKNYRTGKYFRKQNRCRKCFLKWQKEHHSSNWKGGIHKDGDGYILIWNPIHPFARQEGYVLRSHLVAEKYLCRYLTHQEIIHHINGIITDDRPKNLYLFPSQSTHKRYESLKNKPILVSNLI